MEYAKRAASLKERIDTEKSERNPRWLKLLQESDSRKENVEEENRREVVDESTVPMKLDGKRSGKDSQEEEKYDVSKKGGGGLKRER